MSDFGHRFKLLCHKAHPDLFHELDSYFIDIFENALDKEMSKFVHFKHPKTLDEAINLAVDFESYMLATDEIEIKPVESESESVISCLKSGFDKIVKVVQQLVLKRRKPKVKKCFRCLEKGHIRSKCPNSALKQTKTDNSVQFCKVDSCFDVETFTPVVNSGFVQSNFIDCIDFIA